MKAVWAEVSCCVFDKPKNMKHGNFPHMFDRWANSDVHLLLLKSPIVWPEFSVSKYFFRKMNLKFEPVSDRSCWTFKGFRSALQGADCHIPRPLSLSLSHSLSLSLSLSLSPTPTYLGRYYPHPLTYTHPLSTYFPPAPPLFALMPFSLSLSLSWGPLAIESSCNPQLNLLPNKNVFIH